MANKLAGQRAKFSRARAIFYTSTDEDQRHRAAELMAEVLADAPINGFTEDDVTQSEDVPTEVRHRAQTMRSQNEPAPDRDNPDELVRELQASVDTMDVVETGDGGETVYAYGYPCAPDRLKIGSCVGDALARIAAQISTGTPDRPKLHLLIKTHDCRALERALHSIFRLEGKKVEGAGAEWFIATRDQVMETYRRILGRSSSATPAS